jgi:UDP-N-acetyl-D-glucosamine dehydrogenase
MIIQKNLIQRLSDKSATIGIVGLGYVGLPLILRYIAVGYQVVGFDIDQQKVDKLLTGKSYIENITAMAIEQALANGFTPTTDFSLIAAVDGIILCVPTPLTKQREPDLSFVMNTLEGLLPYLRVGQVISLESTTYPGTTEEELLPRIESRGFKVGHDVFLIFSPEREDPGNQSFNTQTIPKICGGITKNCLIVGLALYGSVVDQVVPVSDTRTAEMTKLLENIHRAVNIGLVNEMKMVADKMGIDIYEVIRAAATKPFGFSPYYPGPGLGGHCIPVDPFYLNWKAREYDLHPRFIELAGEINAGMPAWVVDKITTVLNCHHKAVSGSRILLLGIAYKKNVDDIRESPAIKLIKLLRDKGAEISYSDPHVPYFPQTREYHYNFNSIKLSKESLAAFDLVVITTDHDKFDYDFIQKYGKLIVDTRGIYPKSTPNVTKA